MSLVSRYRALLRSGGVAPALGFSIVGRLSVAMSGLATLLLVSAQTGSYATAGAVSAAFALAFAVGSPTLARVADRRGPVRVLQVCAILNPLALVGLGLAARSGAGAPVLLAAAAVAGLGFPPIGAVMRALWSTVASGRQLVTAYSLESVAVEVSFVSGPALVGVLVLVAGPFPALVFSAACAAVGGLGLSRTRAVRAVRPHPEAVRSALGPLSSRAVRALLMTVLCVGLGFGGVEVAVPAFAQQHGHRAAAGVLLAVFSLGSMLGGLLYGGVHLPAPAVRQLPWLVGALALTAALPVLAPGTVLMGAALLVYGFTIAPYFSCNSLLLGEAAPAGTTTEAFAWHTSMIFAGVALGSAVAGTLVQHVGTTAALSVTAGAGLLTLISALSGRHRVGVG